MLRGVEMEIKNEKRENRKSGFLWNLLLVVSVVLDDGKNRE